MAFIGGRRHKSRKSRKGSRKTKRGGNVGAVVNQAIVPFGLLALNNMFSGRKSSKSHKKKVSKKRRSRRTKRR